VFKRIRPEEAEVWASLLPRRPPFPRRRLRLSLSPRRKQYNLRLPLLVLQLVWVMYFLVCYPDIFQLN
jgi:hypothetical protein